MRSQQVAGIEITIFDPDLDPSGQLAATFADALVAMLTARA
jgi:hypothetical protein